MRGMNGEAAEAEGIAAGYDAGVKDGASSDDATDVEGGAYYGTGLADCVNSLQGSYRGSLTRPS